jgi:hypothetical protein
MRAFSHPPHTYRCIEYVRFATNKSRALSTGNSASMSELRTTYPNKRTGYLAALRCAPILLTVRDHQTPDSSCTRLRHGRNACVGGLMITSILHTIRPACIVTVHQGL